MATGDTADMAARIYALIPARWFPPLASAPVLNGILSGIGEAWSFCYELLRYARRQARLSTASGSFLDMIGQDFFGNANPRLVRETDDAFRKRIGSDLLRERATRAGLIAAVQDVTGAAVTVFEPTRPLDTGGYGSAASPASGGGIGYGARGRGYGSLSTPFQVFVTAHRPAEISHFAAVGPYGHGGAAAPGQVAVGGYGSGAIAYLDPGQIAAEVSDARILSVVAGALPVGVIAWTRLV